MSETSELVKRLRGPVSEAAKDLIDRYFGNSDKCLARIPADPERDADLVLTRGIREAADAIERFLTRGIREAADAIERLEIERETELAVERAKREQSEDILAKFAKEFARELRPVIDNGNMKAWLAGYAAAREQAAKVADDHDDGTSREGPLAAHTVAIAIRSMEPEEKA